MQSELVIFLSIIVGFYAIIYIIIKNGRIIDHFEKRQKNTEQIDKSTLEKKLLIKQESDNKIIAIHKAIEILTHGKATVEHIRRIEYSSNNKNKLAAIIASVDIATRGKGKVFRIVKL